MSWISFSGAGQLENPIVNAFATDEPFTMGDESTGYEPPCIVLFRGLGTAVRVAALVLAYCERKGEPIFNEDSAGLLAGLGAAILKNGGMFEHEVAVGLAVMSGMMENFETVEQKMRSISGGAILAVIGHELGHICLHHTLGQQLDPNVSRNQEREADSFTSSIMVTTPFSDYSLLGMILFHLLLSWVEAGHSGAGEMGQAGEGKALARQYLSNTHPSSKER